MKIFIKEIAKWMLHKFGNDLSNIKVVFPNKRSGLFFQHYLADAISQPIWAPAVYDISSFIQRLSNLTLADKYTLLFELYESYSKILNQHGRPAEEFDQFYPWGTVLINDFNDIDKYLVNAQDLFQNISDLKNIDNYFDYLSENQIQAIATFWKNINLSKESKEKESFIRIWEILFDIYSDFRKKLLDKSFGYEGLIYRDVYNKIKNEEIEEKATKVVFIGFNYLTKAEEGILKYFDFTDQGVYFWDDVAIDQNLNFPPFENIVLMKRDFPSPLDFIYEQEAAKQPNIKSVGVSLNMGQAKVLGDLLNQQNLESIGYDNIAVVLADEKMLGAVNSSLPSSIQKVNLTMGYPLRNTQLSAFIELLIELNKNVKITSENKKYYYHKNIIALLKHPYIKHQNKREIKSLIDDLEKENRIFINHSEIKEVLGGHPIIESQNQFDFQYLIEILAFIYQNTLEDDKLEREFIYSFYKELKRIGEIIETNRFQLSQHVFNSIIKELINSITLPFTGEPLSGLQVMGMLETRCLNFSNIYLLNMNEGIMPSKQTGNSYIPYFLRKAFDLPTYDQNDKVLSYYFYRLILNAENVTLLYNAESDSPDGEISRYIKQLKYDLNVDVKDSILTHVIKSKPSQAISIPFSEEIENKLSRYLKSEKQKKFTPSAFNTWLDCKLKFYFRYIADLYEKEEILEEVDQRILGNILHDSMEEIYKSYFDNRGSTDKMILESDFEGIQKELETGIKAAFAKHFKKQDDKMVFEGQNIIIKKVVEKYVKQILNSDKAYAPFEIISMENSDKNYELDIEIEVEGNRKTVGIKGIIDRVDLKGDQHRILDYKSGSDNKEFSSIEELFDRENKNRNKAVFQTILYSLIYNVEDSSLNKTILPALYNVRDMFSDNFDYKLVKKEGRQKQSVNDIKPYFNEFGTHLKKLLAEIYSSEVVFDQTEDDKKCKYCPYAGICRRD